VKVDKIGSVVEEVMSWNPHSVTDRPITYLDLSSVDNKLKLIVEPTIVDSSEAPSRARQLVAAGDVLVSTVRPNLNAVASVPSELDGATASTGFCVLRPREGQVDARYLFQWVRTRTFISEMERLATGASYPAVSDKIVHGAPIPLPPIEEQKRIASILDATDALRTKRRQSLAKLETLTQAIFADMFGDPASNRNEWPVEALGDVVKSGTTVTYGIVQAGDECPGGTPYIRTGDIVGGEIRIEGLRRADPEIADRFPRSRVGAGEIVMSIRATVGTLATIPAELDGANLTQGTARIAPGDRTLGSFLIEYLRNSATQHWIQRQVKGATFREITLTRLRELPVLIPPLELQRKFAERTDSASQLIQTSLSSLSDLDALFAALQYRAFRGEL
jgi:type I restriction enzyme S subunit